MPDMTSINGVTALELTMRDVLDGMEDFASEFGFISTPGAFELLAIEPAEQEYDPAPPPVYEEPDIWCAPVIALSA